ARDTLILTGTATKKDERERWKESASLTDHALVRAPNALEWIRLWFTQSVRSENWSDDSEGADARLIWKFYDAQEAIFSIAEQPGPSPSEPAILPPNPDELAAI